MKISVPKFVMSLIYVMSVVRDSENKNTNDNKQKYVDKKFYKKYDDDVPTEIDLREYMIALDKILTYLIAEPNDTCTNRALGTFFVKAILQRTLKDSGEKFNDYQRKTLKSLIHKSDIYLSHFIYSSTTSTSKAAENYPRKALRKYANFMKAPEVFGLSLPNFRKNQMDRWIYSDYDINLFVKDMDTAVLPKEKYVELIHRSTDTGYHIHIFDSDHCLFHLEDNNLPSVNSVDFQPCVQDIRCKAALHATPSIAYGLSHKVLNLLLYRYQRHCYWLSPSADLAHISALCAFMYKESVYLARRGFFARDMFLQHVGFCGMMGYEEFYRRRWFHVAMRWMDNNGCITENRNYWVNATRFALNESKSEFDKKKLRSHYKDILVKKCEEHPMSVLLVFLGNAVRHAAHHVTQSTPNNTFDDMV